MEEEWCCGVMDGRYVNAKPVKATDLNSKSSSFPAKSTLPIKIRHHQLSHDIYTTEEDKGDSLLSFPMGGSCGSWRPLRPDMGVLVGLVCTDPLRGCALRDRKSDGHSGEKQVRAPPDGGCTVGPGHVAPASV